MRWGQSEWKLNTRGNQISPCSLIPQPFSNCSSQTSLQGHAVTTKIRLDERKLAPVDVTFWKLYHEPWATFSVVMAILLLCVHSVTTPTTRRLYWNRLIILPGDPIQRSVARFLLCPIQPFVGTPIALCRAANALRAGSRRPSPVAAFPRKIHYLWPAGREERKRMADGKREGIHNSQKYFFFFSKKRL